MPSRQTFDILIKSGINLLLDEGYRYNKYDSLATSEDLGSLFEVLTSVKDSHAKPAVMTPVSVVANPDFDRIEQSGFTQYYYEPFTTTLNRYDGCRDSFKLWKEGIENNIFIPQFHCREHLNVPVWIKALSRGHKNTIIAFNNRLWGISTANDPEIGIEYQAAFDFIDPKDLDYHKEVITSGLNLFEQILGYRATYFVPPNGPLSSRLEEVCVNQGIRFVSMPKVQLEPLGLGASRKRLHWLGQKNKSGLICLTRNCFFEPGIHGKDWIRSCLSDIAAAFKWHKPAIISSHRVNYSGALYKSNRDKGLKSLKLLLKTILSLWPETEFIKSDELGEIIRNG